MDALREQRGYSQRQMARLIGVSHASYRAYETGKYEPNHARTIKIAKELDVSVDYLLGLLNE